jgi:SWI/SNF-related matrix-associated actin-dependent regulator of chromatin subfamily A3
MLISLKSGAVGLNLTAASNVFLVSQWLVGDTHNSHQCDPWWQSAIEAQAVDRVHRVGYPFCYN